MISHVRLKLTLLQSYTLCTKLICKPLHNAKSNKKKTLFFLSKIRIAFRFDRIIIDRIHKKWSAKKYIYTKNKKNKKINHKVVSNCGCSAKEIDVFYQQRSNNSPAEPFNKQYQRRRRRKKSVGSLWILVNECLSVWGNSKLKLWTSRWASHIRKVHFDAKYKMSESW